MEGNELKLAGLDKGIAQGVAQRGQEYAKRLYDTRRDALNARIERGLVEAAAKRANLSPRGLLEREVEAKTPTPDDAAVAAFYAKHREQIEAPLEMVAEQIRDHIHSEALEARFRSYMASLREEAGVEVNLPAFRVEVAATGPAKGAANAPVTIVMFSDFECPFCSRTLVTMDAIEAAYGDKVRFVFRDFPLDFHANARGAHAAARCADAQGQFWPMHDKLFENQGALGRGDLVRYAAGLGVDAQAFERCLDDTQVMAQIDADIEAGKGAGVTGTPAFFVNGIPLSGALPFEDFQDIIDRELEM